MLELVYSAGRVLLCYLTAAVVSRAIHSLLHACLSALGFDQLHRASKHQVEYVCMTK